ncbi:hypothetical protein BJ508DRAFT_357812 [Ascobolus immersus RN42]|uniref:Uncharacterized protein n=1 Tax=Ascobolus immersus RN42 TaxID=1160509 RepID=A0A3N4IYF6_ASCIM|nr:hypothetical protein BJ508DRAFT_357812 [Ascobolus immersus RN42]
MTRKRKSRKPKKHHKPQATNDAVGTLNTDLIVVVQKAEGDCCTREGSELDLDPYHQLRSRLFPKTPSTAPQAPLAPPAQTVAHSCSSISQRMKYKTCSFIHGIQRQQIWMIHKVSVLGGSLGPVLNCAVVDEGWRTALEEIGVGLTVEEVDRLPEDRFIELTERVFKTLGYRDMLEYVGNASKLYTQTFEEMCPGMSESDWDITDDIFYD